MCKLFASLTLTQHLPLSTPGTTVGICSALLYFLLCILLCILLCFVLLCILFCSVFCSATTVRAHTLGKSVFSLDHCRGRLWSKVPRVLLRTTALQRTILQQQQQQQQQQLYLPTYLPCTGLQAVFESFDENSDGHISKEELRKGLERLGYVVGNNSF